MHVNPYRVRGKFATKDQYHAYQKKTRVMNVNDLAGRNAPQNTRKNEDLAVAIKYGHDISVGSNGKRKLSNENETGGNVKSAKINDAASRKRGQKWVDDMGINVTGARDGDYLIGIKDAVKDALLRLTGVVPPSADHLGDIKNAGMWEVFMRKLSRIPFFSEMQTDDEREKWLEKHADEERKESHFTHFPNIKLDLLHLGTSFANEKKPEKNRFYNALPPNSAVQLLSSSEPLPPENIKQKFISNTLVMIVGFWRVANIFEISKPKSGQIVLDVNGGGIISIKDEEG
jgi:hypothetical protein